MAFSRGDVGPGSQLGNDHDDGDLHHRCALSLLRTEGEKMTDVSATPAAAAAARSQGTGLKTALRWGLYLILGLFAVYYLMPLFVMLTTSLKSLEEIRTVWAISCVAAARGDLRRLGQGLVRCLHRHPVRGGASLLLELGADRCARRADLDPAWGGERLRDRAMALQGRQHHLRADALRLLHPLPGGVLLPWRGCSG